MSVSQYKRFLDCEARSMAELHHTWEEPGDKTALLVGNYVHSYFESEESHAEFKEENKDNMYSSRKPHGLLKAYQVAEDMIKRVERDPLFQHIWKGEKESIVTGELYGVKWKGKIDCLNIEKGYFVDLKTTADMYKRFYSKRYGSWVSFVEEYGYIIQLGIYEKLLEKMYGKPFKGLIYAVSKESPPNVEAISPLPRQTDFELLEVERNIKRISEVKNGEAKPEMCGKCEYCRGIKKLDHFITTDELIN